MQEEHYIDAETNALTRDYPIEKTLGALKDSFADERYAKEQGANFFQYSFKSEGLRELLALMLHTAAKNNQWKGYNLGWSPAVLEYFEEHRRKQDTDEDKFKPFGYEYGKALDNAILGGFLELKAVKKEKESFLEKILPFLSSLGKVWAVPKKNFAEFVQQKVKEDNK